MRTHFLCLLLAASPGALLATPVAPTPTAALKERVERLSSDAADHYRSGHFREAKALYQAAWDVFPAPGVLFNLARCHEALAEWVPAADLYDKVAVDGHADPGLRSRAADRSRAARHQAAREAVQPPPIVPPPAAVVSAAPAPVVLPPEQDLLRSSAWVLGGVGAVSMVVGGVLLGVGNADHQELEDAKSDFAGSLTRVEAMQLRDQGESRKRAGGVLLALGGLSLVGAIVTLISTDPGPARARLTGPASGWSITF